MSEIKFNVRMRESLRAEIERDAEVRGISMNAAIVGRLEASFRREVTIAEAVEGAVRAVLATDRDR